MELKKDLKSKVNTSQKLLNEGVVIINNFLSNDTVDKIKQEIDIISSSERLNFLSTSILLLLKTLYEVSEILSAIKILKLDAGLIDPIN